MEVPRSAPTQVNYKDVLPLAIPSSSNRRQFLPVNGSAFTPTGSNIIRIDVNADSMLDTQHSYLQYTIANTTALNNLYLDTGPCWISRLRIESGGVTLEDINEYGQLTALLRASQNSAGKNVGENVLLNGGNPNIKTEGGAFVVGATVDTDPKYPITNAAAIADNTLIPNALVGPVNRTFCVPLFSGLLNCEKYIPLILMNAGLTIELTLAPQRAVGIANTIADPAVVAVPTYSITDCRYVAHLIDMDRNFYDSLRQEMSMSGSIAIHGQTWRHFQGNVAAGATSGVINIPARLKSIKSIFTKQRYTTGTVNSAGSVVYSTTPMEFCDTSGWQFQIGSVNYPQAQVSVSSTNLAPSACELLKAFGKLGDAVSDCSLSVLNFQKGDKDTQAAGAATSGGSIPMFCIGYDLEAFQRSALESGIDTANRALPINLTINYSEAVPAGGITTDSYVVADAFFYINTDGTATPST